MLKTHPILFLVVSLMSADHRKHLYAILWVGVRAQIGTVEASTMLWASVAGNVVAILSQPLWALLADKIGRKVFIPGANSLSCHGLFLFPRSVNNNVPMIFLTTSHHRGLYAATNGIYTSWFAEQSARFAHGTYRAFRSAFSSPVSLLPGTALVDGDIEMGYRSTVVSVGIGIV